MPDTAPNAAQDRVTDSAAPGPPLMVLEHRLDEIGRDLAGKAAYAMVKGQDERRDALLAAASLIDDAIMHIQEARVTDTAASIPYEDTDCTADEAVEAVQAVRATTATPLVPVSHECYGDRHDDCAWPRCECGCHRGR